MTEQKPELIREPSSLDAALVFGILIALLAASNMRGWFSASSIRSPPFFCLLSPLATIAIGSFGFRITKAG